MNYVKILHVNASQIRAARALLNWSQEDLASESKLSVATIRKLELGTVSPRGKTNELILRAFEEAGLEFIDPNGVRQRPDDIIVYEGPNGLMTFLGDVYTTAISKDIEIVVMCASEKYFVAALGEENTRRHVERMTAAKSKIRHKCIITENDSKVHCSNYCIYRSMSRHYVDSVPFYVYDNKYAVIDFEADPLSPKITVLHSKTVADAFRRQFYSMWEKATPLQTVEQPKSSRPQTKAR